jgi:hypothetical protein
MARVAISRCDDGTRSYYYPREKIRQELPRRVQALLRKLSLRSETQDNIELCREFTRVRILNRCEIDNNRLPRFGISYPFQNTIAFIFRFALDVALGRPFFVTFHFDGEMNVACAARIKDGLDRAEVVFAAGPSHESAKALEIGFAFGVFVAAVQVNAVTIGLPNFNQHVSKWVSTSIQNAPGEMRDLADRGSDGIVDDNEVVVRIQRKVVRIKWALGLLGREEQLFGKGARNGEEHRAQSGALDEVTAI